MVKRTGPTKGKTKRLVCLLESRARKEKKAIWLDIAEKLAKPRRQRPSINLWKLDKLAAVFKGKNLLIAGKVLGNGSLNEKPAVIALEFSRQAIEKIGKAGGKALTIEEALQKKIEPKTIVIVK